MPDADPVPSARWIGAPDHQHRPPLGHHDARPVRLFLPGVLMEQGEAILRQPIRRELGQVHRLARRQVVDPAPHHRPVVAQEIHQVDLDALEALEHQVLVHEVPDVLALHEGVAAVPGRPVHRGGPQMRQVVGYGIDRAVGVADGQLAFQVLELLADQKVQDQGVADQHGECRRRQDEDDAMDQAHSSGLRMFSSAMWTRCSRCWGCMPADWSASRE